MRRCNIYLHLKDIVQHGEHSVLKMSDRDNKYRILGYEIQRRIYFDRMKVECQYATIADAAKHWHLLALCVFLMQC